MSSTKIKCALLLLTAALFVGCSTATQTVGNNSNAANLNGATATNANAATATNSIAENIAVVTNKREPIVPYVPTHEKVVDEMLRMAEVKGSDVLYDLGSGDGRIPITAARRFGTRGVGVDINPQRNREANENAVKAGVAGKVKFVEGDLFEMDFSEATVVTLYLLPDVNMQLRPKLLALKPGTRVVSHNYNMGDWQPEQTKVVETPDGVTHYVYFWRVPAK